MSEFEREERYIVIKKKDLNKGSEEAIRDTLESFQIPTVDAVVVERAWPCYEKVWNLIMEECLDRSHEEAARKILTDSAKMNIPVQTVTQMFISENGWTPMPTDEECRSIAVSYPHTFKQIRSWFPA